MFFLQKSLKKSDFKGKLKKLNINFLKNRYFLRDFCKKILYSFLTRRDESNDTQIYFIKKISFFGVRGDPFVQKRQKFNFLAIIRFILKWTKNAIFKPRSYRKTPFLVPGATDVFIFFILSVAPGTKCSRKFFLICFFSPKILIFVFLRAKETY